MVYGDNYFQSALSEVSVTMCSHCYEDTERNANAQGIGLLGLMGAVVINIINSGPRVDYSDSQLMGQIYF